MLAIALLALGITSRLIGHFVTHSYNFNPVIAIALFGGFYLSKRYAIILPLALMVISDIFIGFHNTIIFTWGSVALIAALGLWARNRKSPMMIFGSTLASAVIFFVITNFASWPFLYPLTMDGFIQCYTMAIPFFRMTLASALVFSAILFGTYEFIAYRVKDTRLARVLLSA